MFTRSIADEMAYRKYRAIFRKVAQKLKILIIVRCLTAKQIPLKNLGKSEHSFLLQKKYS